MSKGNLNLTFEPWAYSAILRKILASSDLRNELSPKSYIYIMLASDFSAIIIAKLGMMELTLEEKYTVVG